MEIPTTFKFVLIPTPPLTFTFGVTPFPANNLSLPDSRVIFVLVPLSVYLLITSALAPSLAVNIPTLISFVVLPPLSVTASNVSLSAPTLTDPDEVNEITSIDSPPNNASFKTIEVPFDAVYSESV